MESEQHLGVHYRSAIKIVPRQFCFTLLTCFKSHYSCLPIPVCVQVYKIIDWNQEIYETQLAVPVVKGYKTKKEKFGGAEFTTTVKAYISASGRGIQVCQEYIYK